MSYNEAMLGENSSCVALCSATDVPEAIELLDVIAKIFNAMITHNPATTTAGRAMNLPTFSQALSFCLSILAVSLVKR